MTLMLATGTSKNLGTSHGYTTQLSSRHDAGVNLNFADGHVAYFKYNYVCAQTANKATDPGRADINWTYKKNIKHGIKV